MQDIKENIDEIIELIKLPSAVEKECLIGYSERATEATLPVYDLERINEYIKGLGFKEAKTIQNFLKNNENIYLFSTHGFSGIPDGNVIYDEFRDSYKGIALKGSEEKIIVVYDTNKSIEILMKSMKSIENKDEDVYSMAVEYFYFNTAGAWVGDTTSVFITFKD